MSFYNSIITLKYSKCSKVFKGALRVTFTSDNSTITISVCGLTQ